MEEDTDSQVFGIRTNIRVNPMGFKAGDSICTDIRSNSVSILGPRIDEWSFDSCFDSLPADGVPTWGSNDSIFKSFWNWAQQQQKDGRTELSFLASGSPGSGTICF